MPSSRDRLPLENITADERQKPQNRTGRVFSGPVDADRLGTILRWSHLLTNSKANSYPGLEVHSDAESEESEGDEADKGGEAADRIQSFKPMTKEEYWQHHFIIEAAVWLC